MGRVVYYTAGGCQVLNLVEIYVFLFWYLVLCIQSENKMTKENK